MAHKLIIVCGPTASGKTALGIALAKKLNGEVVSADSMQIYRGMEIGTACPSVEEMEGIAHHMLGIVEPGENYSAARYVEQASVCVDDIFRRGKQPIVVGGTGLYIDALRMGRTFSPFSSNSGIRSELQRRAEKDGIQVLWDELCRVDPESGERLHINDEKRIIRALEVWYETGKTISQHNRETKNIPPRYDASVLALNFTERKDLYDRIDRRVDIMMQMGLEQEVRMLLNRNVPPECTAMQAIGYKELVNAIRTGGDISAAADEVRLRSRQYAKRQLTWFRRDQSAHWLWMEREPDTQKLLTQALEFLRVDGVIE